MTRWRLTAEHTAGASAAHCCRTGAIDDVTDFWEDEVDAASQDEAVSKGYDLLARRTEIDVEDDCGCGRLARETGGERWWNSVLVHAQAVRQ